MTNFEKYRDEILEILKSESGVALDMHGNKVFACKNSFCKDCKFQDESDCTQSFIKWLYEEYQEPEIDWSKVPVDTKILVSYDGEHWYKRYFAKYEKGKVHCWSNGATSWTTPITLYCPYAKLAEEGAE